MAHQVQQAPDWVARSSEVWQRYLHEDGPELRAALEVADNSKGYLHWDQMRYRKVPPGWSPEDVWALLKTLRWHKTKWFPQLKQKSGKPFGVCTTPPLAAALHRIDTREVPWKSALGPRTSALSDDTYTLMAAIEEAHHSSAIEGAVTTRHESRELLRSGRVARDRSEQMVRNNYQALKQLDEWQASSLTPQLICEIQATVTKDTLDDPRDLGVVRGADDVCVQDMSTGDIIFQPPLASELSERMEALCAFANETPDDEGFISPVTRAILIHHQLAYDHPFADGNGRTARTLFMWSLLRAGYAWLRALSISRAVFLSKAKYYRSFVHVQHDDGDVTYFVREQLACVEQEIERLASFLAGRERVAVWMRERKALEQDLNSRQLALIDCALGHPETVFTVREHREFHAVSQPTAWKDLQGLVGEELLTEERVGRKSFYRSSKKLVKLSKELPEQLGNG